MKYSEYEKLVKKANEEAMKCLKGMCEKTSQKEAAKELGISEQYLSDVVNGRRDLTDKLLEKLLA